MNIPSFKRPQFSFSDKYRSFRTSRRFSDTRNFLEKHPFASFFLSLGLLFGLIMLGSILSNLNKEEEKEQVVVKNVSIYTIGQPPKVTYQAQVEKAGIIQIVAQTGGIVQQINAKEGQQVTAGQTLVSLSTNYQGGNAQGLQSQLAQAQLRNVLDTYTTQRDLIGKQREIADQTSENANELRDIQSDSLDDIRGAIDTNNTILSSLRTNLERLESTNVGGVNDPLILQTRQGISQVQGGLLQLNTSRESTEYQAGDENPPAYLANLQKDITKKQLDVQEKALELSKTSAQIQANLAGVNAALMYPASPCAGRVERIHVKAGQSVQPGTVIATIGGLNEQMTAEVLIPREIAMTLSRSEPSIITQGAKSIQAKPYYISEDATNGQLYSALYTIPEDTYTQFTDGEYIAIELPVGTSTTTTIPFIPIDSVYQTQDATYVYVLNGNKVVNKKIALGTIFGKYAEVSGGLRNGDSIVLTRNVVAGEQVKVVK